MGCVFRVSRRNGLYDAKSLTHPQLYDELCQECDQRPEEAAQAEDTQAVVLQAKTDAERDVNNDFIVNPIIICTHGRL